MWVVGGAFFPFVFIGIRVALCRKNKSNPIDIVLNYNSKTTTWYRDFLVKFSEFAEAIRQLGLYWLILNQPAPNGVRK